MNGGEEGSEGWGSRLLKGVSVVAATAAVYALLSSSANRQHKETHHDISSSLSHKTPLQMGWKKPKIGWVKLNVDGSRDHERPSAGCGGVLRDESGTWLCGFALKLDPTYEAHETELHAILVGLQLGREMKVEKLIVESDSDSVVSIVENGLGSKFHRRDYMVVERIRNLRFDPTWEVELVLVPRTVNRVANRLANNARNLSSYEIEKYFSPPDKCSLQFHLEDIGQDSVRF